MPVVEKEAILPNPNKKATNNILPTIIKWLGINMIRQESFYAAVKEIITWSETKDITKVGLVGEEDSGKTTLAEAIAHVIHKNSKFEWVVRKFYEKELMKFEETLTTLTPANHILIFDDISFLESKHGKKAIASVKEAVTKIRHLPGGKDVKIILIYNYHYTKGLDKYLRQSHFRFFTTIGSEEEDNMEDIVGQKNMSLIKFFPKALQQGIIKGYFPSPKKLKGGKRFFYKYRSPFIPVLFWNNSTLRFIISPPRHFLSKICSICSSAENTASEISVKQFIEESEKKFDRASFKTVVKQFLRDQGINTYGKTIVQCRRYLDKALEKKTINLEELAIAYNLKPTKTRLDKKLDGVLED